MGNTDYWQIFDYIDGNLFWKIKPSLAVNIGDKAGTITSNGYVVVRYQNKKTMVHRIIFSMFHGFVPKEIDHINRIKTDNRIENLRPATRSENNLNKIAQKNSKSGIKNVSWHKASNKWVVQYKGKHHGCFVDLDEAKKLLCKLAKFRYDV
jgi:hypothetical protein